MARNTQSPQIQQNRRKIEESIRAKRAAYSAEERKEALNRLCGALSGLSIDNLYDLREERLLRQ